MNRTDLISNVYFGYGDPDALPLVLPEVWKAAMPKIQKGFGKVIIVGTPSGKQCNFKKIWKK